MSSMAIGSRYCRSRSPKRSCGLSISTPVKEMTPGERAARDKTVGNDDMAHATLRGWEYEAISVGCRDLLRERGERFKRLQAAA